MPSIRLPRIPRPGRRKSDNALTAASADTRHLADALVNTLKGNLDHRDINQVIAAIDFGITAHQGQTRVSGEPYINHPIQVAQILAEMRMDKPTIIAALLHDVIEDTGFSKDELAKQFGKDVADLVDGVSKLTQINFRNKAEAQAASLRKMILAMVDDLRVILIKLADRLHNMRTIDALRRDKQIRIGRETLDIYAPIANRLGMHQFRHELEDLSFRAIYPTRYRVIENHIKRSAGQRKDLIRKIGKGLRKRLKQEGIKARVIGREKHVYGVYRKMKQKDLPAEEIMDIFGFRIIVKQLGQCYCTLGVVHNLYKPIPGKFKDYIAIPKANGYQSLHTILKTPYGAPVEIQIRTEDMQQVAESGIAAHALYKARGKRNAAEQSRIQEWTQRLLEMQQSAGDSMEFIDHVKNDLFPDEVYVFTPRGEIMTLPRGSTVVDFAYAVHTDVGGSCVEARVDNKKVPLNTVLHNGQTVHIITDPNAHPAPSWLNFVVTSKARAHIRHFLKTLDHDKAVEIGHQMLELALENAGLYMADISGQRILELLAELDIETLDDLLAEIGTGQQIAPLIVNQLAGDQIKPDARHKARPLLIKGTEGTVVKLANCCKPVPGDSIVGYVTPGQGLVIHKAACANISSPSRHGDKWVEVEWQEQPEGYFATDIKVEVANQRGALARIAAEIAAAKSNIEAVNIHDHDGATSSLDFTIQVESSSHIQNVLARIRRIKHVMSARRVE